MTRPFTPAAGASWSNPLHAKRCVELWVSGHSASQVSKALIREFPDANYTRNAVIGKLHRLGYAGRPTPSKPSKAPKRPKLYTRPRVILLGNGVIATGAADRPPVEDLKLRAFEPLEDTSPRPWGDRTDEQCTWPVGDGLSCCEPVHVRGWCMKHHALGTTPTKTSTTDLARSLRRFMA